MNSFIDVLENNTCRYIAGDPREGPVFCSNERKKGSSYCKEHHGVCHTGKIALDNHGRPARAKIR